MVLHELRKTLAWYSRGLFSGAELRHRCFAETDPSALLDLGEGFFARLAVREASHGSDLCEPPSPPETKCQERHARHLLGRAEEREPCDV
jgi:hypothetical protein